MQELKTEDKVIKEIITKHEPIISNEEYYMDFNSTAVMIRVSHN